MADADYLCCIILSCYSGVIYRILNEHRDEKIIFVKRILNVDLQRRVYDLGPEEDIKE